MKSNGKRPQFKGDRICGWHQMFGVSCIVLLFALLLSGTSAMAREKPLDLLFNQADTDHNGLISEAEWHAVMQKRFETNDANHDGNISRVEIDAVKETFRERFRSMRSSQRNGNNFEQ
jgi:Ca2+-binding EF-hand superfamily protein